MSFYDDIQESQKEVDALPGFKNIYVRNGTTQGLYELFSAADNLKMSEQSPEEAKEGVYSVLYMLFKHFLVNAQGEVYEEMCQMDEEGNITSDYSKVPPDLMATANKFIANRMIQGKNT